MEADDRGADAVADPDAVLLVDGQMERGEQAAGVVQRVLALVLAVDARLGRIALRQMHDLALALVHRPDVAGARDDDALHLAELAVDGPAVRRRQRLAALDRSGRCSGWHSRSPRPCPARRSASPKPTPEQAAAGEAGGHRRQRLAVRGELRQVAVPQDGLVLRADDEVVADPGIALAVEHQLAAAAVAAAGELQRQHPGARGEAQVGHEGRGAHLLARGHRIEGIQQREQPVRLMRRVARDGLGHGQRVGGHGPGRRRCGGEQLRAGIRGDLRGAAGEQAGQRGEVRHASASASCSARPESSCHSRRWRGRRSSARCRRRCAAPAASP